MNLKKLWKRIRSEFLAWVERNIVADDPEDAVLSPADPAPTADPAPADPAPSAKPWRDCRLSSNWGGSNASKRMMNLLSPKFSDAKVKEYLDWQGAKGCDHVHLLFCNQADGEGAGYDALTDSSTRKTALQRVQQIRARGLGVVAWIVSDDSDSYRKKIFADPAKYADGLKEFMPFLSYIVLGLEMNEGEGSSAKWKALRDAIKAAGWTGPFATHHTSGKSTHAGLGSIVMDQLDSSCSTSDIAKSVKALKAKGYEVCGFEYLRGPDRTRAMVALDAGAFSCGNWDGGASSSSSTSSTSSSSAPSIDWKYGGFNGSKAQEDSRCRISSLKVTSSGCSLKWESNIPSDWKRDKGLVVCAVFYRDNGKWVGGKFDWIDESRKTRDFKNIEGGYNGWSASAFRAAKKHAFCVVSADGKYRSNLIED